MQASQTSGAVRPASCPFCPFTGAAYAIFANPAQRFSGQFLIDDYPAGGEGLTDFESYRTDPPKALAPDFFVTDSEISPPGVSLEPVD